MPERSFSQGAPKTPEEHAVCDAVLKLRKQLRLSQPEFARQLGCHVRTICRWEAHDWVPGKKYLLKLQQLAAMQKEMDTRDRAGDPDFRSERGKTRKKKARTITGAWYKAGIPLWIWKKMKPAERRDPALHEVAVARICLEKLKGGNSSGEVLQCPERGRSEESDSAGHSGGDGREHPIPATLDVPAGGVGVAAHCQGEAERSG